MFFTPKRYLKITATIIDLCLCLFLSYALLSNEMILAITDSIFHIKKMSLSKQHLFVFIITYFFYYFYSALFFSLTLGQLICGVRIVAGSFFLRRLSAIMRLFLLPIRVILDLFSRDIEHPWNIKLTGSRLVYRSKVISYFLATLLCLIAIGLTPFSPLMYKQQFISHQYIDYGLKSYVEGEIIDFESFKEIGSKTLGFSSFTNLANSRFELIPSYEIRKVSSKTIFRPLISLWDNELNIKGSFKISSRFDLYQLVNIVKRNLLFFNIYYPELNKALELSVKDDREYFYINQRASLELFELITNAFLLDYRNVPKLLTRGHFQFLPYLQLKLALSNLLELTEDNYIDFIKSDDTIFVRKKDYSGENIIYRETFFSLAQLKPIVYKSVWDRHLDNDKSQIALSNSLFFKARWGKKVEERYKLWIKEGLNNPLFAFDFLNFTDQNNDYRRNFEKFIVSFYADRALSAITDGNQDYIDIIRSSLQRYQLVFKTALDKKKVFYSKATIKGFNDILLGLKLKDKKPILKIKEELK